MSDELQPRPGEVLRPPRRLPGSERARWGWLIVAFTVLSLAWVKSCTPVEAGPAQDARAAEAAKTKRGKALGLAVWRAKITDAY
jgi:hypothetical protein